MLPAAPGRGREFPALQPAHDFSLEVGLTPHGRKLQGRLLGRLRQLHERLVQPRALGTQGRGSVQQRDEQVAAMKPAIRPGLRQRRVRRDGEDMLEAPAIMEQGEQCLWGESAQRLSSRLGHRGSGRPPAQPIGRQRLELVEGLVAPGTGELFHWGVSRA
jgi:hypothetical protein